MNDDARGPRRRGERQELAHRPRVQAVRALERVGGPQRQLAGMHRCVAARTRERAGREPGGVRDPLLEELGLLAERTHPSDSRYRRGGRQPFASATTTPAITSAMITSAR